MLEASSIHENFLLGNISSKPKLIFSSRSFSVMCVHNTIIIAITWQNLLAGELCCI